MTKLHTWSTSAAGRQTCSACGVGYWGADRPVYCEGAAWGPWIEHDGSQVCPYPEADGQVRRQGADYGDGRDYSPPGKLGGFLWFTPVNRPRLKPITHYRLRADHPHYQSGRVTSTLKVAGYAAGTWRAGMLEGADRATEIANQVCDEWRVGRGGEEWQMCREAARLVLVGEGK